MADDGDVILRTRDLAKTYGRLRAVEGVDLTVRRGEVYGFLGRNGAGKTTTIRLLLALVKPTAGSVEMFGQRVGPNASRVFERVGSMVETPGSYGNLTVRENLDLQRGLLGLRRSQWVDEAIELCGLGPFADKRARSLSLGTKQRLGLARAILHRPEVLILDEPTNGMDPVGIVDVRDLLGRLAAERQTTIIVSSHILAEIQHIATRIGIIHRGRLVEEIDIDALRSNSRTFLEFRVSDPSRASWVLEELCGVRDFSVHEENAIRVFSQFERAAELNRMLLENGVEVSAVRQSEENLEDHFLRMTGGVAEPDARRATDRGGRWS
jgi:bacitracin transport system ATP-binding protein